MWRRVLRRASMTTSGKNLTLGGATRECDRIQLWQLCRTHTLSGPAPIECERALNFSLLVGAARDNLTLGQALKLVRRLQSDREKRL